MKKAVRKRKRVWVRTLQFTPKQTREIWCALADLAQIVGNTPFVQMKHVERFEALRDVFAEANSKAKLSRVTVPVEDED